MANNGQIYVAKESFATTVDGASIIVTKDITRVREGHALLKGREKLFEPLKVHYDIEQATARPGETRGAPAAPAPTPAAPAATTKPAETPAAKAKETK